MATIYTKDNMSTSDVKKMQQALVDAGYSVGKSGVDGIWGKDTSAALSAYKAATGGSNSYGNTVGKETFDKLYGSSSVPATTQQAYVQSYTPTASKYDADIMNAQGQVSALQSGLNGIANTYNYIEQMYGQGGAQQNQALQQAMGANADQINSAYNNSARDYYRLYKTQQKALPENLSKAGVTGGASESSQLKLMNSYSDNIRLNESARNNALAGNTAEYNNQIAQNSINMANKLASAYMNLAQQENAINQQLAGAQSNLNSLYAAQQQAAEVDKWNANVTNRINQQLSIAGGDTLWTYTTDDGKLHWTTDRNNAKALSGLYDLNEISSVTKSSSSSKKASGATGSGSGSSSKATNDEYNTTLTQAKMRMLNDAWAVAPNQINTTLYGATGAVNYIENSNLTEAQKNQAYKDLGLV